MTSSGGEDKKSRRINFSPSTKLKLAKAAGFYCSYPACLVPTTGPSVDDDGNDSAAGIAVAAHIYPASKNGPRKKEGMTAEQIRSVSNGIWLCHTHGTLIDELQHEFPAEMVIEMKNVREYAQSLSLKLPDVAFFVGYIGVKRLDAIVRKHWPNPDQEKIRVDVISEGIKCTPASDDPLWTQMPTPPAKFDLKPIQRAASPRVVHIADRPSQPRRESFPNDRRRAIDIISSWRGRAERNGWNGKGFNINYCYVKITAREPGSGDIAETFLWVRGDSTNLYDYTLIDGESLILDVNHTGYGPSNLNWHLNVTIKDGAYCTTSTLRILRPIRLSVSYERHEKAEFEAYAQILEKLASGWEPIGYVGIEPSEESSSEKVFPEPFSIRNEITEGQLAQALKRCARVRLGYELAEIWGLWFYFNNTFFNNALDETIIWEASVDLLDEVGPAPYPTFAQGKQLVSISDRTGIRLTIKNGRLFFDVANTNIGGQRTL